MPLVNHLELETLGKMLGMSLLLRHNDGQCRVVPAGRAFPLPGAEVDGSVYRGLVILVVQHDDEQAVRAIKAKFHEEGFPDKMTWDVGQTGVYQPPEEILPGPRQDFSTRYDIWSCLRLRGLGGRLERYEGGLGGVSRERIERDSKSETTVGTWICHRRIVLGPTIVASSLIVLVFRAEDHHIRNFASRLEVYLNKRRSELVFDAMAEQPLYIYIALYQCFNSFTTFFYQYQAIYEEVSLHQEKRITSVFSRSFRLSQTLIQMSYGQEDIPMHKTVLMKIRRLVNNAALDQPMPTTHALEEEVKNLEKDLDDFEDKYKFFSERFKTALELEFSLSGERLNWIMMLFTALTVLFTPIAFVAAVFSIIDSDPVWFLISGSAVLCISIAICLWAFSSIQGLGHKMTQGDLRSIRHKLPYQGPDYRRPKGPDGDSPPPHDPRPGPQGLHGPKVEGRMSGHESGHHRPPSSQPPRPPSPPPRPPVSSFRPPVSYSQWRPPPVPPPMSFDPEGEYRGPYAGPKPSSPGPYRRVPPPAMPGMRQRSRIPVARASSNQSYSSGDSLPEVEVLRPEQSRLRVQEAGLRGREAQLREREQRLGVERGFQVQVGDEDGRRRAEEQTRRSEEARRVLQEGPRREGDALSLARKGKMPES